MMIKKASLFVGEGWLIRNVELLSERNFFPIYQSLS